MTPNQSTYTAALFARRPRVAKPAPPAQKPLLVYREPGDKAWQASRLFTERELKRLGMEIQGPSRAEAERVYEQMAGRGG